MEKKVSEIQSILLFENPLNDIMYVVPEEIFAKYSLPLDGHLHFLPEHQPLLDEIKEKYPAHCVAGGSAQNSARACQWMLNGKVKNALTYCGVVGNDENGEILKKKMEEAGVKTKYSVVEGGVTAHCHILIQGLKRCMVARIGCAVKVPPDFCDMLMEEAKKADLIYTTAYFMHHKDIILKVAAYCAEKNKIFAFNTADIKPIGKEPYFFNKLIPYCDILIGNKTEFKALGEALSCKTEKISEIAKNISLREKVNKRRERIVVATQGKEPTTICIYRWKDGKQAQIGVQPKLISKDKIKSVNGAGDSFVGGFLAGLILGENIETAAKYGNYTASTIIQRTSCEFPEEGPHFS